MLPSSGYFRGIACPAHARGACGRPYCHFHHDVKERNVSSPASSSQSVTPAPAQGEADAEEENRQGTLQDQDMRQGLPGCSTTALSTAPMSSPEPEGQDEGQQQEQQPQQQEQQESEPHTSQPAMAAGNIPKPELLHQLMNEALKKVLAENPTLASTVEASAIRIGIGIDPVGHASPEGSKTKKTFYPRPPDTPSYNPTPIRELKKRKVSVDGGSSLGYTPTGTTLAGPREAKRNEEEEEGGVMGEFSSSDGEEVEKNDDFDLLEEVLAEHSKNNKVKVKKKRVKELGKLQYSLINADKRTVDNNVLIADAKKLTDKEVKRYEVAQVENVNKVITDGPYFLPPSPVFTSSSDGFEAFNSRASYQDEEEEGEKEKNIPDKCPDKPLLQTEFTKANSEPASEKNTVPKQSQEPSKSSEKEQPKASGHTHLPKLLPTLDAPKLSRPNVRNWIPLVRNPIPVPDAQKNSDQLDEMLKMMDGSDASNKRKSKESEHQTSSHKNSENARPRKKYKVDLNKEIESLTNPAVDQVKETVAPEEDSTDPQPETSNSQDGDKKRGMKEEDEAAESHAESKEKRPAKKTSRKDSEDKKKRNKSESENSDEDSHTEESEDSRNRRGRHKKKRKRSRSSSSDSGYSRHRKKKRKRSHRRHRKRSKKYRKRRDSTSSLSDQSKDSEEEQEGEEEEEDEVDEDGNDNEQEEEEVEKDDEEEENENKSKEDSESDNKDDSNDEVDHRKKSRRHRKKHKHYRKSKRRKNRRKAKRKRKRSKSYSRSRSSSGSRDSSRSRSRSRSSSKHRKKKSRSRHRSRNESDSEERDSDRERSRSRSRSSSRHSSKRRKSRESREKDSGSSKLKESSKSKDERLEEEGRKVSKGDRKSRDRSSSKSRQQGTNEESSKKHSQEETPIPLPVDPSKIKVEKNASDALIPDLSKVKVEKEESSSEKLNTQVNTSVHTKGNDKSHEDKRKGQSESRHSKTSEKIHGRRRSSTEEKGKRRLSHDRKDSTESVSDKGTQRRQSCESKTSDAEASQQRKKPEERRPSSDKNKMTPSISSQPSEMSMFDLVLASTKKPKPKTLTEISIFDSLCSTDTKDREEASDGKGAPSDAKKSKDTSHKSGGDSGGKSSTLHTSDHKSGSSSRTHKSSRSDKEAHTDSHHKHDKNDNKSSHSSSKNKSSSSSSSHHHSNHSSNSNSSSSHKKSSSSSSRGSSSKHHNASATSATTTSTTSTTSSSSSSKPSQSNSSSSSSSSKNKKASELGSSKSEKDSSRHSSTSNRKHSSSTSSSSKHQDSISSSSNRRRSRSSSSSSKHKENKGSGTGYSKLSEGSGAAKKRKVSVEEDSPDGVSDNDHFSSGAGDSPLPDLSVLDEIPQDDWEQMLSGSEAFNISQEPLEESDGDDMDHDDPGVMEECMKMFNEFQQDSNPLENQVLPKKIKTQPEDSKEPATAPSKQRVARSSSSGNLIIKKSAASRHQKNNPMQRMVERYQKLKEELKLKEQQLHHLQGGSSAVSSSSTSRTSIAAASSSTHHSVASSSISGKTKKRIAHVPNVSSLLNSQGKILNHSSSSSKNKISPKVARASGVIPETTAHTVAKGGKRVAHVPRPGSLARPIIQPEHGSLVPQNIRQRYLNALIEECKKFCTEREAFNIAAAEERVCYQRAPSRMVYLNLVVNAVKRLRTQQQAGEGAQELLDRDPQLAEKMCVEEPSSSSSKPSTSPSPSSSPSSSRSHPVNPNHVQLSHTTVLSSGGFKGSWSIEKSKKTANSSDGALKGETFYKHLLKYVLTEEQLEENGYPGPDPEEKGKAVVKKIDTRKKISPSALERYCDRCSALYNVDKWGFPKTSAPCVHHWGRPYKKRKYGTFETTYSCCGGEQGSAGCSQATTHVSQNYNPKNLRGYVRTISKDMSSSNKEVYALDCEMCYTTEGNELTRVTVIGWDGNTVYEQLVKPDNPILDYNTRFSGITESDMEDVTLTIRDVQAALLARFSDKTILIGHSLESDLHALKMIHNTVVDTSVVFPHKMGAPYKRALKNLAAEHLKRIIQDDVSGHDSAEDAIACLHLMQWKVKEGLKGFSK